MEGNELEKRIEGLEDELARIKNLYGKALSYQNIDPEVALWQARKSAEAVCKQIYLLEGVADNNKPVSKMMLNDLVQVLARSEALPTHIIISLRTIQDFGNFGTHDQGQENAYITEDYIKPCLQSLATVVEWYFNKYHSDQLNSSAVISAVSDGATGYSQKEIKYCKAAKDVYQDGIVNPEERKLLSRLAAELGLPPDRAREIEGIVRDEFQSLETHSAHSGGEPQVTTKTQIGLSFEEWQNTVCKRLVSVPNGTFIMGSEDYENEGPPHEIALSSFFMMKCPVTQKEYEKVMGSNPSNFLGEPNRPVEQVSWYDAAEYCNRLSKLDGLEPVYWIDEDSTTIDVLRNGYRLPSEAEWEYACRAMNAERFFWGPEDNESSLYAWFDSNSDDSTHRVGTKRPNPFGLYDMVGNVWEWCNDWFSLDYYSCSENKDPQGPEYGEFRVLRGGCWFNGTSKLRSAARLKRLPHLSDDVTGFRCVARFPEEKS